MGEVWRGVDVGWGGIERPVAVKVIAPSFAREPEFVRTFIDEARLSYLLCHANVVNVRDIGQLDETLYIAMEWVDGGDLGAILRKLRGVGQPMPIRFAVLVAVETARGLDYAHRLRDARGEPLHVVHRDISPSNLLVSYEGEVKITDFGIARSRLKTSPSMPGALKGKMGYLAPEQARGDELDLRSDLYALGVVLYEMLTGVNPFTHKCTEREALARVQKGTFQPPRAILPSLPQGLEAIVLRAMAPERDARYADCGAMREDLEAFARREGYALSAADLGAFARDVLSSQGVDVRARTDPALQRISKPRTTAPKPFDVALGENLARLDSSDDLEAPPAAAQTMPGKRLESPRTVAVHPVIDTTPKEQAKPATEETEEIPRTYSRRALWITLAVAGAGAAISIGATLAQRGGSGPEVLPPVVLTPSAPVPSVLPKVVERIVLPVEPKLHPPRARAPDGPARLSVESDVAANIYIDGQFVQVTPLEAFEVAPGRHTVRAESSTSGLRLIPREETVMLKAGESRRLNMDFK
jgi:serine/threonine protein kinase